MGKTEERLAAFIVDTSLDDIPAASFTAVRDASLDCVGVILAGAAQPHGRMIVEHCAEEGARGDCSVLGTGLRLAPSMAALANGTLGHALDYDDMGGFGHPSVVLFPASLALSEQAGRSGRELLGAYIIGFEVGRHISKGTDYRQGERGFHSTAVFGAIAATAASCRLLGLDRKQTQIALGIAASTPSGVLQNFGTHTKPLHAGLTGRSAVMAASLARKGFLGTENFIESHVGWAHAYLGEGNYNPAAMVKDLGTVWYSQDSIVIKKYPCCGSNHSALDSILGLIREHGITLDQVDEIEVGGFPAISHVLLYPDVASAYQGKFSIHFNLAAALLDGKIEIDTFNDDSRLSDPAYREALSKLEIKIRSKWESGWEAHPTASPVTVRMKDGRVLERATDRHHMHGTPSDPLTRDELEGKFRQNARLALSDNQAEDALRLWSRLDQLPDVREATAATAGALVG